MKKLKQLHKIGETIADEFEEARIAFAETHDIFHDYYLSIFYECYTDTHGWVRYLRRELTWRLAMQLAINNAPLAIKQMKQRKETRQAAKNSSFFSPKIFSPGLLAVMHMPNVATTKTTPAKAWRFRWH